MKKILMLTFIVMVSTVTIAQISWSVRAGINLSSFTGLNGQDKDNLKTKLGYQFVFGMDYALNEKFSIQPSLLFITKGARFSYTNQNEKYKASINPMYIDLPVLVAYKFYLAEKSKLAISAGPYVAYGNGGKWEREYTSSGVTIKYHKDVFGNRKEFEAGNVYTDRPIDFGLCTGIALEYHHYLVGINASWGFVKFAGNEYNNSAVKNVCYSFSTGYIF
jgi:hypothetical protein